MTSKIVVNNIEADAGINTVTIIGDVSVGSSITATDITGTHHGSGADLTNLPAANLTGTVADARLTSVTASKLSGALPAISAANLTSIPAANITGTFGSVNASNLTNIPAGSLTGIVTAARLGGGSASSSTFLRGDGTFAEAGGGTVGAYVTHSTSTSYTFTTSTMQNGVHSATITPTKASSKILVLLATYCKNAAQPNHGVHAKTRFVFWKKVNTNEKIFRNKNQ